MDERKIIEYIEDEIANEKDTASWFTDEKNLTRKQIEESIEAHQRYFRLI